MHSGTKKSSTVSAIFQTCLPELFAACRNQTKIIMSNLSLSDNEKQEVMYMPTNVAIIENDPLDGTELFS